MSKNEHMADINADGSVPHKPTSELSPATHVEEEEEEEPSKTIPHLPVVLGGLIFIIALGGVVFASQKKQVTTMPEPMSAPILINGQSSAAFQVDYGKAGMYAAYTPGQKIVYSAGTNAPAKSVEWVVCNSEGSFIAQIPLAMQSNIDDPVLKARRWKSTGAPAFTPGKYQVTVRAESVGGETASHSFYFDPIRGVNLSAPGPECRTAAAGI